MNWTLLKAIKERGLTQRSFARAVNDHESIVSRIVCGTWNPDERRQRVYSRVLGMRPEDLFVTIETRNRKDD